MFINEYGDKNNPLFLLLAPMMVSGEDLYQLMHPYGRADSSSIITPRRHRRWKVESTASTSKASC